MGTNVRSHPISIARLHGPETPAGALRGGDPLVQLLVLLPLPKLRHMSPALFAWNEMRKDNGADEEEEQAEMGRPSKRVRPGMEKCVEARGNYKEHLA